jgi:osmotically-inducible protein OsmY
MRTVTDGRARTPEPAEDQRIAAEITERIRQNPYAAIRQLSCEFREGVAILRGSVPTFHARQVAIELARAVDGVQVLDDRIQVISSGKAK